MRFLLRLFFGLLQHVYAMVMIAYHCFRWPNKETYVSVEPINRLYDRLCNHGETDMRRIKGQIDFTFEDSEGYNPTGLMGELVFSMDYIYTPGEETVRYYKDGSGHPGTPPEIEYENIQFRWIDEGIKHKHLLVEQMMVIQNWFMEQLNRSDSIKDMVDTIVEKDVANKSSVR